MRPPTRILVGVALVAGGVGIGRVLPRQGALAPVATQEQAEAAPSSAGLMATALLTAKIARLEHRLDQLGVDGKVPKANPQAEAGGADRPAVAPPPPPRTPQQIQATKDMTSIVEAAVQKRFWSDADRKAALNLRFLLPPDEMDALTDQLVLAVNRQELKTESPGFPLSPPLR